MGQLKLILKEISLRFNIKALPKISACILSITLVLLQACAGQKNVIGGSKKGHCCDG